MVEDDIDRMPKKDDLDSSVEPFQGLKTSLDLTDGWRTENPEKIEFSFHHSSCNSQARLDRIYIKSDMVKHSRNWGIKPSGIKSADHDMVHTQIIDPGSPDIGKGRWTIPSYALKNKSILKEIKSETESLQKQLKDLSEENPPAQPHENAHQHPKMTAYGNYKETIRKKYKNFCKKYVPITKARIESKVKERDEIFRNDDIPEIEKGERTAALSNEINYLQSRKYDTLKDKIRVAFHLEQEVIGKRWLSQIKECKPRDAIIALQEDLTKPNALTRTSRKMARVARAHHISLQKINAPQSETEMSSLQQNIESVLQGIDVRITEDEAHNIEATISKEEVRFTIKEMSPAKAPGLDGIPNEFWQLLVDEGDKDEKNEERTFDITEILADIYNELKTEGLDMESTFHEGWMCPLYKKGDRTNIANYRPITVLNTDYKILTKLLTIRIAIPLLSVIHLDQAGFLKGRRIHTVR